MRSGGPQISYLAIAPLTQLYSPVASFSLKSTPMQRCFINEFAQQWHRDAWKFAEVTENRLASEHLAQCANVCCRPYLACFLILPPTRRILAIPMAYDRSPILMHARRAAADQP
jgi:hypothetical protein